MKIKVYTADGYKIVNVEVCDDVKMISKKYSMWEYVLSLVTIVPDGNAYIDTNNKTKLI